MNNPRFHRDPSDRRADRAKRRLRMLEELAELGMTLARGLAAQAMAPPTDHETAADLTLAFTRVARAVRQTVALEARLADDQLKVHKEHAADLAAETRTRGARRKRLVEAAVERAIESEADGGAAEELLGDLYERLADPRDDADFADRPIGELVARICKDLGVKSDPRLWEDEDWAIEEARLSRRPRRDSGAAEVSGDAENHPPPIRRRLN